MNDSIFQGIDWTKATVEVIEPEDHAELNPLSTIVERGLETRVIGNNKLQCLICHLVFLAMKISGWDIEVSGCHGKIYSNYTFPIHLFSHNPLSSSFMCANHH